jgi:hypothetical protein
MGMRFRALPEPLVCFAIEKAPCLCVIIFSAIGQDTLMEITLEPTSFSCEERSKLGQDLVYTVRKTHDGRP